MTYHETSPNGFEVKKHLHAFLVWLKRYYPCGNLWILEFQKRKIPHYHLYLTISHNTPGFQEKASRKWHEITGENHPWHLWWHMRPDNFIAWDMRSGSYVCKYLDKSYQKEVPAGFEGVGRFWGCTRNLVPPPDVVDNPAIKDVRILCKHHEKSLKGRKWRSAARRSRFSYRLPNGAAVASRLIGGNHGLSEKG
jgi:hypothetical protein